MESFRKTKTVKIILDLFEKRNEALPAIGLIKYLNQCMNKATVYRILDRLEEKGVLHSFIDNDGYKRYAKCLHQQSIDKHKPHPHFQCRYCGKVQCLHQEFELPSISNHKIENAALLLIGQCKECIG